MTNNYVAGKGKESVLDSLPRVILVEEHPIVRYGMRVAIESNGIGRVVAEVDSSDELLSALKRNLCDVVVTDFSMPGGCSQDGLALVDRLVRTYPHIPIVIVTALRNPALLNALLRKGVKGLVGKTGDVIELHKALSEVSDGHVYVSPMISLIPMPESPTATQSESQIVLTNREVEVLRLFAYEGLTAQEISLRLERSPKTVSRHKRSAQSKLGLHTDQELLEYCSKNELVSC